MKNSLLTLAFVAFVSFLNLNPAFGQLSDTDELQVTILTLRSDCAGLVAERKRLEDKVSELARQLAEADDSDKIAELREDFQAKIARIIELETEVATYKATIQRLETENSALVAENTRLTEELDMTHAVAVDEPVEDAADYGYTSPGIETTGMPPLDPSVFGRTGYCGRRPPRPSPVDHPEVRASQARDFVEFKNILGDYVFLRVPGISSWVSGGKTISREILVAPDESCYFISETGLKMQMTTTPAFLGISGSSEYSWDGFDWVSVVRASGSCHLNEYEHDGIYSYGPFSCQKR